MTRSRYTFSLYHPDLIGMEERVYEEGIPANLDVAGEPRETLL